jgi:Rps23 Pro-64 3,4-dihydroxylase Tpa1-like proline 4-hydroxylase
MHFDSDAAVDGRRVTAILYLNPGWRPGDGGELRLYPFPQASARCLYGRNGP